MRQNIKKYFQYLLLLVLTWTSTFTTAWAGEKDFPPVPNPPRLVSDLAGFMRADEAAALEAKLEAYSDSTSNEIAIVTVQSIGQYDIADYTVQLFNKWHIGGKKNNNGILILAAKEERKIWMTTGYGLEGALPDGLVGQIIREEIEPNFKQEHFYEGFEQGTNALIDAARGEYTAEPKAVKGKGGSIIPIIIIIIIFVVIFSRGGRGGGGGLLNNVGWIAASMLNGRSSGSGWGGGSSDGGGFGGFGGGSSGGGGAGGSW
ncbi:MAG: TPM domain-containing protein [Phycisphaerales bacterium]|nr:TPM domain-containing protein [Phycisphaerales bacterium]